MITTASVIVENELGESTEILAVRERTCTKIMAIHNGREKSMLTPREMQAIHDIIEQIHTAA